MLNKIYNIVSEYGIKWSAYRTLYWLKLKFLNVFPFMEFVFESNPEIKRIDLFQFDLETISSLYQKMEEKETNKIIYKADRTLEGKINVFSNLELDYGLPIKWNYNPITGGEHSYNLKWFEIPDFDRKVGDIKVIWEASRFTHFLLFARAYTLTRDKKYYFGFENQLKDWLENNKYGYGPNYKCGQEATLRMINVLIAYSVFNQFGLVTDVTKNNVYELVKFSYKKVDSNFFYAHKCIKNNHTFTEIIGQMIGSWAVNSKSGVQKYVNLMEKEIDYQFTSEGGFRQYSYNYQRFTLHLFSILFKIEDKLEFSISKKHKAIINDSVILLYNLSNDKGMVPNYGSNDGALIFPMSNSRYRDYRPVLGTVFSQINKKNLYEVGLYSEEQIWFSKIYKDTEEITKNPMSLNEIGTYTFNTKDSLMLVHLNDYQSRPAHMDQLHIDLWYKNVEVFCDLGTYSYASDLGNELSSNSSHNTASIPRINLFNKKGAFLTYNWSKSKLLCSQDGCFIGLVKSMNGYAHKRSIKIKEYGYEIEDLVTSNLSEEYYIHFHTPLDVEMTEDYLIIKNEDKPILKLINENKFQVSKWVRSVYYLRTEEITKITIKIKMNQISKTEIHLMGGEFI